MSEPERIAKRLARAGIASRRDAEALIAAGRVKVNGTVLTSPAFNVRNSANVLITGRSPHVARPPAMSAMLASATPTLKNRSGNRFPNIAVFVLEATSASSTS